jgi:isoaspartyl peptidase/L-asparaginase-like protein (Ntn-hydrolase superfamily)
MKKQSRRNFLSIGVKGAAAGMLLPNAVFAEHKNALMSSSSPLVISTWNHGLAANDAAWEVLANGGKSLDAVEQGVRVTESDLTNRSVGIGGMPDRDGHVTLDACIMDEQSRCGAVGCLEGIDHPISVARAIMEHTPHVMLVGEGAREFALARGFGKIKTPIPEVKEEYKKWYKEHKSEIKRPNINHENHDTIGMLAIDSFGNLSGSCTTSGWAFKMHGRLGDSPIIGAGLFVDNEIGAACATGLGEAIIRIAGSHTVVELMRQGYTPDEACKEAVDRIIRKHSDLTGLQCGFLALRKDGVVGSYSVYNGFNYALRSSDFNGMKDAPFNRTW